MVKAGATKSVQKHFILARRFDTSTWRWTDESAEMTLRASQVRPDQSQLSINLDTHVDSQ